MSTLANLNPSLNAPLPGATAAPTGGGNAFGELESTDFVRILVEELSNQDPFEPNDSAAILEQLSSLRSIESDLSLQGQLENLVLQNSIGQAGSLIGREVEGLTLSNDVARGTVTSVRVVDGSTEVQLDTGVRLPLERVTEIAEAAAPPPAAAPVASVAGAGLTGSPAGFADPADSALRSLTDEADATDG